jgi:hypothetical protein
MFGVIPVGIELSHCGWKREFICHRNWPFSVELAGFVADVVDRDGSRWSFLATPAIRSLSLAPMRDEPSL